jgi:hypothetical protein
VKESVTFLWKNISVNCGSDPALRPECSGRPVKPSGALSTCC